MKVKTLIKLLKFILIFSIVFLFFKKLEEKYNIRNDYKVKLVDEINADLYTKVDVCSFENDEYVIKSIYLKNNDLYYNVFNYYFNNNLHNAYVLNDINLDNEDILITINENYLYDTKVFKMMKFSYRSLGINKMIVTCGKKVYYF